MRLFSRPHKTDKPQQWRQWWSPKSDMRDFWCVLSLVIDWRALKMTCVSLEMRKQIDFIVNHRQVIENLCFVLASRLLDFSCFAHLQFVKWLRMRWELQCCAVYFFFHLTNNKRTVTWDLDRLNWYLRDSIQSKFNNRFGVLRWP